jgi:lysophospholipase L1-like esterase
MIGATAFVPWPLFSANYRNFIDTILSHKTLADTKIVLITPPPLNGNVSKPEAGMSEREIEEINRWRKEAPKYKTYMSKKRYAEGIMQIASEYEGTGRVAGLNFWQDIMDAMIEEEEKGRMYDEQMPPGCGLMGSSAFPDGWFTDGLHLNVKGYNVLSKGLMELLMGKWPELAPEKL